MNALVVNDIAMQNSTSFIGFSLSHSLTHLKHNMSLIYGVCICWIYISGSEGGVHYEVIARDLRIPPLKVKYISLSLSIYLSSTKLQYKKGNFSWQELVGLYVYLCQGCVRTARKWRLCLLGSWWGLLQINNRCMNGNPFISSSESILLSKLKKNAFIV